MLSPNQIHEIRRKLRRNEWESEIDKALLTYGVWQYDVIDRVDLICRLNGQDLEIVQELLAEYRFHGWTVKSTAHKIRISKN